MKKLNTNEPVYYESKRFNNGNPIQVVVVKINGKTATVKTCGDYPQEFKCRLSSLYN